MEEIKDTKPVDQALVISMKNGNTTFLIGLHFNKSDKETMDDK